MRHLSVGWLASKRASPSFAASVVMTLAYGTAPERYDDPDIVAVEKCLRRLGENLLPGKWKVSTFPLLK